MSRINYSSTRDEDTRVSFEEALLTGLAPDGGLYLPQSIPKLTSDYWKSRGTFADLAVNVLGQWLGDEIQPSQLEGIVREALDFPVPLTQLHGAGWEDVFVLELFRGPTHSFKDFGARTMARLMSHFTAARNETVLILVATSGDTGSAVADGFAGQAGIRVALLYPRGQVSPVQERQLIAKRPGVTAFAVDGTFDDCQRMVKGAMAEGSAGGVRVSTANSINIGRLLPQMLYYMWGAQESGCEKPLFCVPSGNLGNLTGGVLASMSGLPVHRFIAAHNANDFFPRFLEDEGTGFSSSVQTLSNAMDVGAPSNFERLRALLPHPDMQSRIHGESVTDEETLACIRRVHEETAFVADPHTAVGLEAVQRFRRQTGDATPAIVLGTAHPAKFPEVVRKALGFEPPEPEELAALRERETQVQSLDPSVESLRRKLAEIA